VATSRSISFRPLAEGDLALVRTWLLAPHVRRWWDEGFRVPYPDGELDEYRAGIRGEDPTLRYLIELDGMHVGLIQHYRIGEDPEYAATLGLDEDAVGTDLFIGDPDLIGQGQGPAILRRFLLDIAFPFHGLDVCVIGPSVRNAAAIRAYEKAGFVALRDVVVPHERDPERLMRGRRADLERSAAP
jgi:RimJ/RimL family protein N-acetyltransferase